MTVSHADALGFFGATGDLAYTKIFPSPQAMVKRGHLNVPVVGVAKAGWNLDQLRARAREGQVKRIRKSHRQEAGTIPKCVVGPAVGENWVWERTA